MGKPTGSWEQVGKWYGGVVEEKGHYFHQKVIIPGVLRLLELKPGERMLDLGCGNGVLARHLPPGVKYVGVDMARSLVEEAIKLNRDPNHEYWVGNAAEGLPFKPGFGAATIILALQNMAEPEKVVAKLAAMLDVLGRVVIVVNHPCFRIPRQSGWGIDEERKIQYRRVDRYLSPIKIPITIHPGEADSPITWDFHYPISAYVEMLKKAGLVIENLEEWVSDKTSVGKAAKMENFARAEFPLFLAIMAKKIK